MVFLGKSLLDTLLQILIMLRHLIAEISRFEFDDYRVSRTRSSDLKLFLGGVFRHSFLVIFRAKFWCMTGCVDSFHFVLTFGKWHWWIGFPSRDNRSWRHLTHWFVHILQENRNYRPGLQAAIPICYDWHTYLWFTNKVLWVILLLQINHISTIMQTICCDVLCIQW